VNSYLEFLLSPIYTGALHPLHLADLKKYPLSDETIRQQGIRSIPSNMITQLLRFDMPGITSAMLFPFADPAGGWMDHVRMKVFPSLTKETGRGGKKKTETIKYLQPKGSGVRLYFPITTMRAVFESLEVLWIYEGEKKSALMAQLYNRPTVGLCGVEGWHAGGSEELLTDFDHIPLKGRVVKVVPDGDVEDNVNVSRAIWRFGAALERHGALPHLVHLPQSLEAAS
jgi:uncharacterized protein DUF3854